MSVRLDHSDHSSNTRRLSGEPPYSVGQSSANDLNANTKYPTLDTRIETTYAKRSTARSQRTLYDSYIRAFRWASDRIDNVGGGVVAFVSNGGWIDANTADGIRLSLIDDYSHIYLYNLRGNMRNSDWKKEGGQVFGAGSQATIAIFIGVKDPTHAGPCQIYYTQTADGLTRDQKLATIAADTLRTLDWQSVTPNPQGDWINQRDTTFPTWPTIGEKRSERAAVTVFNNYSLGLATGRDAWCYSAFRDQLIDNATTMIGTYEAARNTFHTEASQDHAAKRPGEPVINAFLDQQPQLTRRDEISWNSNAKQDLAANRGYKFHEDAITTSIYRPFYKRLFRVLCG